ncbi:aspartate aminotransferase family protein [bacterium]|nr:aspartate aminotransferase family protein [bacterium]
MRKDLNNLRSEGDLNISPLRKAWAESHIDPETQKWLDLDAQYFLHQSLSTPCLNVMRHCEGIYIEDLQGRRYMDFHGNNVHQVGFDHPKVIEAIKNQLDELAFCTRRYTNIPAIRLAEKLTTLAPGDLNKVLFAPGGTSAIGIAMKLARAATGRFKTISMWDAFHGASLDAISIGGEAIFRHGIGPLLPGAEHVPPPDAYRSPFGEGEEGILRSADYIEYVLEKEGDVGAVIAESVRSTPFIPSQAYWQKVRQACDKHGALLILDEIPHCLGRTGTMFTFQNFDVIPDMVAIGKGLGGGVFPLAAIVVREELNVMPERALGHYTHEKNPVACAAALAALEVIEEEGLLQHSREVGAYALERMQTMQDKFNIIGDVRGIGLLMGIELVKNRETKERATEEAERVMYNALSRGLSFKLTMGNILTLTPPLIITKTQMDEALAIIEKCIQEVTN